MKNFKQIALGLLVGAMAIGFSAFTTANSNHPVKFVHVTGKVLQNSIVQTEANASFEQANSPSSGDCSPTTSNYNCIYTVTEAGAANIPDQASFSASEMDSYLTGHSPAWLTASGTSSAVYVAP